MFPTQEPQFTLTVSRAEAFGIIATLKKLPMDQVEQLASNLLNQVVEQEQKLRDAEVDRIVAARKAK